MRCWSVADSVEVARTPWRFFQGVSRTPLAARVRGVQRAAVLLGLELAAPSEVADALAPPALALGHRLPPWNLHRHPLPVPHLERVQLAVDLHRFVLGAAGALHVPAVHGHRPLFHRWWTKVTIWFSIASNES